MLFLLIRACLDAIAFLQRQTSSLALTSSSCCRHWRHRET